MSAECTAPLRLVRLVRHHDRLEAILQLSVHQAYTHPRLSEQIRKDFPRLVCHTCVNEAGDTLAAVLEHTSLAHVLEHLVIELMAQSWRACQEAQQEEGASNSHTHAAAPVYVGSSEWLDAEQGIARVQIGYINEKEALQCLLQALSYLNTLVGGEYDNGTLKL